MHRLSPLYPNIGWPQLYGETDLLGGEYPLSSTIFWLPLF